MNREERRKKGDHDKLIRLDLGCGKTKQQGFIGVDARKWDGVDVVCNLGSGKWPWKSDSVHEVHCSHMVEHLTPQERIHFVNELHRVMKVGAKAKIITPNWSSTRAYGDLTHQWPPVSEMWYHYLLKAWRDVNAPHNDFYTCDFDVTWGYNPNPSLAGRNDEYVQHALTYWKDAGMDIIATFIKREPAK